MQDTRNQPLKPANDQYIGILKIKINLGSLGYLGSLMNLKIRTSNLNWVTHGECSYLYVSRLLDITAGGDFLGLCDQKSSYKHVSDFVRLRSYDRLKLDIYL